MTGIVENLRSSIRYVAMKCLMLLFVIDFFLVGGI